MKQMFFVSELALILKLIKNRQHDIKNLENIPQISDYRDELIAEYRLLCELKKKIEKWVII